MPRPLPAPDAVVLVAAIALLVGVSGCAGPPAVDAELPPGALLSADRAALDRVARCVEAFRDSPAAVSAARLRQRVASCDAVTARAESGEGLWEAAACATGDDPLAGVRGDADVAFAVPQGDTRWVGTARVGPDGAVAIEARATVPGAEGLATLATPDAAPPGPALLADSDALLHARYRARGGIDVAALVPQDGQAQEMFGLKGGLFAGALLDGTWEAAVYLPPVARAVPRMAIAVGTRSQSAARLAMDEYVARVAAQWKLSVLPFAAGGETGSCLGDLHLLPGLAPCFLSTPDAVVLGWDVDSVMHATRAEADATGLGGGSGAVVHLDRLPAADQLVAAALGGGIPPVDTRYPWGTVTARADAGADDLVTVRITSSVGCAAE